MKELKERVIEYWIHKAHKFNIPIHDENLSTKFIDMIKNAKLNDYESYFFEQDVVDLGWVESYESIIEPWLWNIIMQTTLKRLGKQYLKDIMEEYSKTIMWGRY